MHFYFAPSQERQLSQLSQYTDQTEIYSPPSSPSNINNNSNNNNEPFVNYNPFLEPELPLEKKTTTASYNNSSFYSTPPSTPKKSDFGFNDFDNETQHHCNNSNNNLNTSYNSSPLNSSTTSIATSIATSNSSSSPSPINNKNFKNNNQVISIEESYELDNDIEYISGRKNHQDYLKINNNNRNSNNSKGSSNCHNIDDDDDGDGDDIQFVSSTPVKNNINNNSKIRNSSNNSNYEIDNDIEYVHSRSNGNNKTDNNYKTQITPTKRAHSEIISTPKTTKDNRLTKSSDNSSNRKPKTLADYPTLYPTSAVALNAKFDFQKDKKKSSGPFIPWYLSIPFAFLISMENSVNEPIHIHDIGENGQRYCNRDIRNKNWAYENDMRILIKNSLVDDRGDKYYSLNPNGAKTSKILNEYYDTRELFNELNGLKYSFAQNQLTLVVDNREKFGDSLVRNVNELGMEAIIRYLPSGDYLFIKTNATRKYSNDLSDTEFYPILFERKTWQDLESSMVGGRLNIQANRMNNCPMFSNRTFFIIEGSPKSLQVRIDTKEDIPVEVERVWRALHEKVLEENFNIIHTNSLMETGRVLAMIGHMLVRNVELEFHPYTDFVEFTKIFNATDRQQNIFTYKIWYKWSQDQFIEYIISTRYRAQVQNVLNNVNSQKILMINNFSELKKTLLAREHSMLTNFYEHRFIHKPLKYSFSYQKNVKSDHITLENVLYWLVYMSVILELRVFVSPNADIVRNIESLCDKGPNSQSFNLPDLPESKTYFQPIPKTSPNKYKPY
eukprot:gene3318-4157_t